MGAEPYWYYVDYQTDIGTTLKKLRQREFNAGRYNPVLSFIDFPISADSPVPGAQHPSIEAAMIASEADGTRSILDLFQASDIPFSEAAASGIGYAELCCKTYPLTIDELLALFGTDKPTHEMVESVIILTEDNGEAAEEFWDSIDRGTSRHIIIYKNDKPAEVFFVGYSFD